MKFKIVSNTATKYLFDKITNDSLVPLKEDLKVEKFSDGEMSVQFTGSNRGKDLFIFGETAKNLTELLLTIDAAKRSSAKSITVILPYYGYGRQDKKEGHRGCLGGAAIANVLQAVGINRVVSIDLHADQIQGFFSIPCEHIKGHSIFLDYIKTLNLSNTILCSPDAGGIARVGKYSNRLNLPLVSINKRRDKPNSIASMDLIGEVTGKDVLVIDDMVDTCGTLKKAVGYLKEKGAKTVTYVATHPVLSGKAFENITDSQLDNLIVSDTVYVEKFTVPITKNVETISCVPVLEKVIINLIKEESISQLND